VRKRIGPALAIMDDESFDGHGLHCMRGDANSGMADAGCGVDSCAVSGVVFAIATPAARRLLSSPFLFLQSSSGEEVRLVSDPAERAISERNRRNEKKGGGG
jgi:hypothetical protein